MLTAFIKGLEIVFEEREQHENKGKLILIKTVKT